MFCKFCHLCVKFILMNWEKTINSYFKIAISSWQWPGRHKTADFIWIPVIPSERSKKKNKNITVTITSAKNKQSRDADSAEKGRVLAENQGMNLMTNRCLQFEPIAHHCYLSMSPSLSILLSRSLYRTARTSRISRIRLRQFRKR